MVIVSGCETQEAKEVSSESTTTEQTTLSVSYTVEDVAAHATVTWCRSIIRNNVYDFTARVSQHPGWPEKILGICWTDATPIFEKVHWGKEKPEMKLEEFLIWVLK